ncbi:polycomb group RING finger protein 1-like [Anneissia japonica]|uniref:polycomb group RING finger protein 1-like n=1 Tax=Anneissia japonica TaxID=1529436 RepID=UPI001425847D|nr:polycomb group RING finger protein 1-like [Anneissia japonica]XP_033099320.1 polycomb group RING finger protein 1-like [Anneissia japonica]
MFSNQSLKPGTMVELEDEKPLMLQVCQLNQHIVCILCAGYFVDATTITECLHTFCKSCIVKYLQTSKHCPMCNIKIHETQPLVNLRPDRTMQDIVFTLVPHLWKDETLRKREFYRSRGIGKIQRIKEVEVKKLLAHEQIHHPTQDHLLSLCLEHISEHGSKISSFRKKYVRCSVRTCIYHLQKMLRKMLNLASATQINILCKGQQLGPPETTMKHVWLTHWFQKPSPMTLHFKTEVIKKHGQNNPVVVEVPELHARCHPSVEALNMVKNTQCKPPVGKFTLVEKIHCQPPKGTLTMVESMQNQPLLRTHTVVESRQSQPLSRTHTMVESRQCQPLSRTHTMVESVQSQPLSRTQTMVESMQSQPLSRTHTMVDSMQSQQLPRTYTMVESIQSQLLPRTHTMVDSMQSQPLSRTHTVVENSQRHCQQDH